MSALVAATWFTIIVWGQRCFHFSRGSSAKRLWSRFRGWTGNAKNGDASRRLSCDGVRKPRPDFQMRVSSCHRSFGSITGLHMELRPPTYQTAQCCAREPQAYASKSGAWNRIRSEEHTSELQ